MKTFFELLTDLKCLFKSKFVQKQKVADVAKPPSATHWEVINKCGCISVDVTSGSVEDHEKLFHLEADKLFFSCQIQLWNEQALDNASRKGYPELVGSERQVAWALNIRDRVNLDLPPDHPIFSDENLHPYFEAIQALRERLVSITEAVWWIDNRKKLQGKSIHDLVEKVRKRYKSHHIIIKYINKIGFQSTDRWESSRPKLYRY